MEALLLPLLLVLGRLAILTAFSYGYLVIPTDHKVQRFLYFLGCALYVACLIYIYASGTEVVNLVRVIAVWGFALITFSFANSFDKHKNKGKQHDKNSIPLPTKKRLQD